MHRTPTAPARPTRGARPTHRQQAHAHSTRRTSVLAETPSGPRTPIVGTLADLGPWQEQPAVCLRHVRAQRRCRGRGHHEHFHRKEQCTHWRQLCDGGRRVRYTVVSPSRQRARRPAAPSRSGRGLTRRGAVVQVHARVRADVTTDFPHSMSVVPVPNEAFIYDFTLARPNTTMLGTYGPHD